MLSNSSHHSIPPALTSHKESFILVSSSIFQFFINGLPFPNVQFSSVAQSCPTLCDPMHRSTPGLPVHHQLPEFTQTRVHLGSDAIHLILCHHLLLLPPSLPTSESFPMSQLFTWGVQSIGVSALASFFPKNIQDWSHLEWTGWISLQSKGLSRVFSNTIVQKHQSLALSFLHSSALTSIHDHRKNHSLD